MPDERRSVPFGPVGAAALWLVAVLSTLVHSISFYTAIPMVTGTKNQSMGWGAGIAVTIILVWLVISFVAGIVGLIFWWLLSRRPFREGGQAAHPFFAIMWLICLLQLIALGGLIIYFFLG